MLVIHPSSVPLGFHRRLGRVCSHLLAIRITPRARVTVTQMGRPSGMAATAKDTPMLNISSSFLPCGKRTRFEQHGEVDSWDCTVGFVCARVTRPTLLVSVEQHGDMISLLVSCARVMGPTPLVSRARVAPPSIFETRRHVPKLTFRLPTLLYGVQDVAKRIRQKPLLIIGERHIPLQNQTGRGKSDHS